MAEEQQQQQQDVERKEEPINAAMIERPKVDFYLQNLVTMANTQDVEMGITLVLGGTVITGQLISGKTYFESFGALFASAWNSDEDGKKAIQEAMSKPAEMYGPDKSDAAGPSFIHLKNATVRTPSGALTNQGVLWRGRLTEVSGFMLGEIK
ncbi:gas vesicle accessory protein GvpU [Paraburkholderia hospita]|uniref:gas vesicle accessory protein GvpU n=1 Tax=Paraburkholderia hospita TaxID=169430 RepID=UPI003ED0D219